MYATNTRPSDVFHRLICLQSYCEQLTVQTIAVLWPIKWHHCLPYIYLIANTTYTDESFDLVTDLRASQPCFNSLIVTFWELSPTYKLEKKHKYPRFVRMNYAAFKFLKHRTWCHPCNVDCWLNLSNQTDTVPLPQPPTTPTVTSSSEQLSSHQNHWQ